MVFKPMDVLCQVNVKEGGRGLISTGLLHVLVRGVLYASFMVFKSCERLF